MAAVEFLRWGDSPDYEQYRRVRSLLERSAGLDPMDADRHYWFAATALLYSIGGADIAASDGAQVLDQGIEHATEATRIEPRFSEAIAVLAHLYRAKADLASDPAERTRLNELARATYVNSLSAAAIGDGRSTRDDQFSRPPPPPPPE